MNKNLPALFLLMVFSACSTEQTLDTVCNPMDLTYRFALEDPFPSRREAADPSVVRFRDKYFLFVSKSGGYWWSENLAQWHFVQTDQIPTEEYAPTAVAIDDTLFFLASSNHKSTIYATDLPFWVMSGNWYMPIRLNTDGRCRGITIRSQPGLPGSRARG